MVRGAAESCVKAKMTSLAGGAEHLLRRTSGDDWVCVDYEQFMDDGHICSILFLLPPNYLNIMINTI